MKRNRNKSGRGMTRKVLAAFLSASVLLTQVPMAIYAEDAAEKGLCAHHTQHTEECGYREAKAAVPCGHICSAESGCITTAKSCTHTHGTECYPEGNTESEPSLCTHVCSEESGCITKAKNCVHTHEASGGYAEAVEAKECKYVNEPCPDCEAEAKAAAESEAARKAAEESERAEQEKQQKIQTVQALIDALPEANGITAENLETVKEQLAAIEEGKAGLDESSQAALNLARYTAAVEKTAAVEAEQEAALKAAEEAAKAEQEKQQEIQTIQALIDALPEADGITAENLESVKGQLSAIEEAKAGLDESSQSVLNLSKYTAAVEKTAVVEAETKSETETEKPKPKRIQKVAAATGAASVTIGYQTIFYDTLEDALNAASGKTATITVLKEVDESGLEMDLNGDITLIGGNHTIKFFIIRIIGRLTVVSGKIDGGLYVDHGTLNVKGGVVSEAGINYTLDGTINISGGTVEYVSNYKGTTNISGGDVDDMYNDYGGTVNISGGDVGHIDNITGTVNISGGDVDASGIYNEGGTVNDNRQSVPEIYIDYKNEKLRGFKVGNTYTITYTTVDGEVKTLSVASTDGAYPLEKKMLGTTLSILCKSPYQKLSIPARPEATFSVIATNASTLTASSQASGIEYSFDAGKWGTEKQWTGLKAGSSHSIKARIPASDNCFGSGESQPQQAFTSAASYTITIPSEVTAGGTGVTIEPTALDLGKGGKVAVSVSGGLNNNGKVILQRDGAQDQIFAPLSADGGTLSGATPTVGNITGMNDSISLSVGTPATADNSQILAGAYTGNVTFTYQYSEQ